MTGENDPTNSEGESLESVDPEVEEAERASQRRDRIDRMGQLRAAGVDPYPYRFNRTHDIGDVRAEFEGLPEGTETETTVRVAGRLMLKREQGRLTFGQLRDGSGEIQLFVSAGVIGKESFAELSMPFGNVYALVNMSKWKRPFSTCNKVGPQRAHSSRITTRLIYKPICVLRLNCH